MELGFGADSLKQRDVGRSDQERRRVSDPERQWVIQAGRARAEEGHVEETQSDCSGRRSAFRQRQKRGRPE